MGLTQSSGGVTWEHVFLKVNGADVNMERNGGWEFQKITLIQ